MSTAADAAGLKARWEQFKKTAWDSRPPQDRRVLAFGAAVLAPILAYVVLWQPAHAGVAKLQAQLPEMRTQAALMRREAREVEVLQQQAKPAMLNPTAMRTAIENSAAEFQLRGAIQSLEGMEPNGVRISFASVPYAQWLGWVRRLQQEQHIRVDTLSVVALQTEGMVKIDATLVSGVNQ
jgi:general secretion pathway protein M